MWPHANADTDAWYKGTPEAMGAQAYEDYRAGLGIDREHDADRGHSNPSHITTPNTPAHKPPHTPTPPPRLSGTCPLGQAA